MGEVFPLMLVAKPPMIHTKCNLFSSLCIIVIKITCMQFKVPIILSLHGVLTQLNTFRIAPTVVVSLMVIISSCSNTNQTPDRSLNGTWSSLGSGWILQIQDSAEYGLYDITSVSCLTQRAGKLEELMEDLDLINDTLSMKRGVMTYQFVRVSEFPELCQQTLSDQELHRPLYNFEVFAQTVSSHYAFMELNGIDWPQLYAKQKQRLELNPTNLELYLILEETLAQLNDNHAFLEASEDVYLDLDSLANLEGVDPAHEGVEYGDFQVAQMVAEHHMQENMTKDSWLIQVVSRQVYLHP